MTLEVQEGENVQQPAPGDREPGDHEGRPYYAAYEAAPQARP